MPRISPGRGACPDLLVDARRAGARIANVASRAAPTDWPFVHRKPLLPATPGRATEPRGVGQRVVRDHAATHDGSRTIAAPT